MSDKPPLDDGPSPPGRGDLADPKPATGPVGAGRHLILARQEIAANSEGQSRCMLRVQMFNADGSAWGPEVTVEAATENSPIHPAIAALADGRFALAWQHNALGQDNSPQLDLRVQLFNADDSPWQPGPSTAGGDENAGTKEEST